jgi:hypothetical protein
MGQACVDGVVVKNDVTIEATLRMNDVPATIKAFLLLWTGLDIYDLLHASLGIASLAP